MFIMTQPTILVVDDNPTNLKLVSDVLECSGYPILKAEDAEAALAVIQKNPPALILMDIALPGMDGLTLTRKLKSEPTTKDIRIIALTAFCDEGRRSKGARSRVRRLHHQTDRYPAASGSGR